MTTVEFVLRRPIARWNDDHKYAACPRCQADVTPSLGSPLVTTMRLANQNPGRVSDDVVNVRGYVCRPCEYVLAIDPNAAIVAVADPRDDANAAPWIRLGAVFADGSKRPVVVPRREVRAR